MAFDWQSLTTKKVFLLCIPVVMLLIFCQCSAPKPFGAFNSDDVPPPPNYALADFWAALPTTKDMADSLPLSDLEDLQDQALADVFFLHPTTYTKPIKGALQWNAPANHPIINERTDGSTILYQASIFNGAGKVYAPRYRQAHIEVYFTETDTAAATKALHLAYQDVKAAFEYYLKHYNAGRPIIIASHSQGATHAIRLLKEFFDGQPLMEQLIVAYLVGMPVQKDTFQYIAPCRWPTEVGCFCSWQTYRKGYYPDYQPPQSPVVATNPILWTINNTYAPRTHNAGSILRNFNKLLLQVSDAQVHDGLLWVSKPKFPGSFLFTTPRYHIIDLNLFYMNIRKNASDRVSAFFSK